MLTSIAQMLLFKKKEQEKKQKEKKINTSSQKTAFLDLSDNFFDVAEHLEKQEWVALATTSKSIHSLFQSSLFHTKVLQYIVHGEEKKAETLLQQCESNTCLLNLLCFKGRVNDYSGRKIEGTAYRIALGAGDINMLKMLRPYFLKAFDGDEKAAQKEIKRQFETQFPLEYRKQEKNEIAAALQALEQFVQVFRRAAWAEAKFLLDAKNNHEVKAPSPDASELMACYNQLISHMDKKKEKVITEGKHFYLQLLLEVYKKYNKIYVRHRGWDKDKNKFFWRHVVGYTQRFLPACDAQALCQGTYFMESENLQLNRGLRLRDNFPDDVGEISEKNVNFFPLDKSPCRLGFNFAVYSFYEAAEAKTIAAPHPDDAQALQKYMKKKEEDLTFLTQQPLNMQPLTRISASKTGASF